MKNNFIKFAVTLFFAGSAAEGAVVFQCGKLKGLVGEPPPQIIREPTGLYVKTSIKERLTVLQPPNIYSSPSFEVKFGGSWGISAGATLTLKRTGESVTCK